LELLEGENFSVISNNSSLRIQLFFSFSIPKGEYWNKFIHINRKINTHILSLEISLAFDFTIYNFKSQSFGNEKYLLNTTPWLILKYKDGSNSKTWNSFIKFQLQRCKRGHIYVINYIGFSTREKRMHWSPVKMTVSRVKHNKTLETKYWLLQSICFCTVSLPPSFLSFHLSLRLIKNIWLHREWLR
jgi:hypothetical protein